MTRSCITFAILAAWILVSAPARAQIATTVDEHGKLIYVNGDSPAGHRGSSMKAPAVGSRTAPVAAAAPPADGRLDRIVQEAAERHKVDPALVKAVITTESGWNPYAVSRKGALGLMQLIPGTAQRYGVGNAFDPAENVEGGTKYLKSLLDRYDGDLAKSLAAYNAGERAVDLSGGVPAYRETQRYVQKVSDAYFQPGSGRDTTIWSPLRPPVRREVDPNGRVVFTNE